MIKLLKLIIKFLKSFFSQQEKDTKNITKSTSELGFKIKPHILSNCELNFSKHLSRAIPKNHYILVHIRLIDVISGGDFKARAKLIQKHIDFLICNANKPILAIELDDKSHNSKSAQKRDKEKDMIFESAGLPALRVKASNTYDTNDLSNAINKLIHPTKQ